MYVCMYVCMYVYIYIYIYICMCVCVCVCVCVYKHTNRRRICVKTAQEDLSTDVEVVVAARQLDAACRQ